LAQLQEIGQQVGSLLASIVQMVSDLFPAKQEGYSDSKRSISSSSA
jgi:hypothetical protein